ncbi:MAG: bifunctional glutamate N-acetyltransferase/amino-acid acetyltransferase ArgJ [Planctomycetes bacterium]|nr:bifunctional glutamate N-acetyltransferase/amino-acid acetyltransferase ArgJ [Planctomycetota bacterium]
MDSLCPMEKVPGFKCATAAASIRDWPEPRDDVAVIVADAPAAVAGVFTQNQIAAAPVKLDKKHLKAAGGMARAILVNAGVANACTGREGRKNAEKSAQLVADRIGAPVEQVLVASTGVIGRQLPMDKMETGIAAMMDKLGKAPDSAFANAIMTTDIRPKQASVVLEQDGGAVLAGCCKGSGMIAPNMATMLAFVLTDMDVSPKALKAALKETADSTFNMVTVDGDTSTNDTLIVMASGAAECEPIRKASGKRYDRFLHGLYDVSLSLSRQIAADGEGATKLVMVKVTNAARHKDAVAAAKTIAESPLVKTAMFGNDPNWGRIIMALGRSPATVDESKTSLTLCGKTMFSHGAPMLFDAGELSRLMKSKEVTLEVDLGLGTAEATALTCDFSYDYVKINADYTT